MYPDELLHSFNARLLFKHCSCSKPCPSFHLNCSQAHVITPSRCDSFAACQASEPEIRIPSEAAKYVAHIITGFDAATVYASPVRHNPLDDFNASVEDVVNGDDEAVLISPG